MNTKNASLYAPIRSCFHSAVTPVWDDMPHVFAGARAELRGRYDVVLDCTGLARSVERDAPITISEGDDALRYATLLACGVPEPLVIALDWPDGGLPPVTADFWRELLRALAGTQRVAVCCMGGHGRTGTALVALRMAYLEASPLPIVYTLADIIDDVRFLHCDHAVETSAQCDFLRALAPSFGVQVGEVPLTGSYAIESARNPPPPLPLPVPRTTTIPVWRPQQTMYNDALKNAARPYANGTAIPHHNADGFGDDAPRRRKGGKKKR